MAKMVVRLNVAIFIFLWMMMMMMDFHHIIIIVLFVGIGFEPRREAKTDVLRENSRSFTFSVPRNEGRSGESGDRGHVHARFRAIVVCRTTGRSCW